MPQQHQQAGYWGPAQQPPQQMPQQGPQQGPQQVPQQGSQQVPQQQGQGQTAPQSSPLLLEEGETPIKGRGPPSIIKMTKIYAIAALEQFVDCRFNETVCGDLDIDEIELIISLLSRSKPDSITTLPKGSE